MSNTLLFKKYKISLNLENQDGGVGRHTASPRTTRTDRNLKGKEVRHQVDKKETYIQTGRRGRDGHRAERTHMTAAGPRLAECGMNVADSLTTSRPCGSTFAQIGPEGRTQSGGERGRQSGR